VQCYFPGLVLLVVAVCIRWLICVCASLAAPCRASSSFPSARSALTFSGSHSSQCFLASAFSSGILTNLLLRLYVITAAGSAKIYPARRITAALPSLLSFLRGKPQQLSRLDVKSGCKFSNDLEAREEHALFDLTQVAATDPSLICEVVLRQPFGMP
jgi:hypothetical protein